MRHHHKEQRALELKKTTTLTCGRTLKKGRKVAAVLGAMGHIFLPGFIKLTSQLLILNSQLIITMTVSTQACLILTILLSRVTAEMRRPISKARVLKLLGEV